MYNNCVISDSECMCTYNVLNCIYLRQNRKPYSMDRIVYETEQSRVMTDEKILQGTVTNGRTILSRRE